MRLRRIKKFLCGCVLLGICVMSPVILVHAGNINGNEARVLAAANGTFTYNGKQYKAGSAYINQLEAYLAQDDVDLTSEQADEAISMMYGSVADGVAQGYLYEVGGGENGDTQLSSEEAESKEEAGKKDVTEAENKDAEKSDKTGGSSEVFVDSIWNVTSNPTETKEKLKKRPLKEEASAAVVLEDSNLVVTTGDRKPVVISKSNSPLPSVIQGITLGIGICLLAVTLVCGVVLWVKRCLSFGRPKHRRARPGHSKRRKIRHFIRNILTVTTSIALFGCFLFVILYAGLFYKKAIIQSMQSSGYFRYEYAEYIAGMGTDTGENSSEGELKTYEQYFYMMKQNTLKALDGETETTLPDNNIAPYIGNLKTAYMEMLKSSGSCMLASAVLGIILMLFMDQRRERGVKHTAAAQITASSVLLVLAAALVIAKPYAHLYIEPDYLYLFLMEYIGWCVKIMISVTAFAVAFGMILIGIYRMMRNGSTEVKDGIF